MAGNGPRRTVTMADVAVRAGVSVTTVSHVVNRTRPVSPATERTVLAAVAESGYVPDDVVRSLRTTGSRTIGLALSAISNTYFAEIVRSAERALAGAGYSLLLADTHDDELQELRAMTELLSRRVDAILLAPSAKPRRALEHAAQQGVPVVLVDRVFSTKHDQVAVENIESTAALVTHVADNDHRNIALIGGRVGLSTTRERERGYKLGLTTAGRRVSGKYLVTGDSTVEGGRKALTELLALAVPPTAVVVGNNAMMIGVMHALRDHGLEVPRDLALVGFDDFEWADFFRPRLTVMAQPLPSMGQQAADMILARLRQPGSAPRTVVMNPTFVHRDSCGCTRD